MIDLAFAGIAGQAELLRRGEVSARELAQLSLERIERLDGELNAFAAVYPERALREADRADARRRAGEDGPLLGVPLAVKDEIDLAGEVTSRGTGAFTAKAAADAEIVRRLGAAGMVVVGKTTMPELGLWPFTESITWGVTRNPWDLERTPGGSSGGSAAAVAAGIVPVALGADGAGSIRIPAACCGLFGLKPQTGRVTRNPHTDGAHWVCFGPLTRSVLDSALVLDAATGTPAFSAAAGRAPGRLRIARSDAFPPGTCGTLTAETRAALDDTEALLRGLGHEVVHRAVDMGLRDIPVIVGLMLRGIHDLVAETERPQRLERRTRALGCPGALISDTLLERMQAAEQRIAERVNRIFDDHDVVLTPMMSRPAVRAGVMEGRGAIATYNWETGWVPFNVLWNSTGQPAASVPAGFTADGLPLAVQLVGRADDEATLLSLSGQIEAERPWAHRRPPL
nr:amidase [Candidatus Solirubrobacter pratensis]